MLGGTAVSIDVELIQVRASYDSVVDWVRSSMPSTYTKSALSVVGNMQCCLMVGPAIVRRKLGHETMRALPVG